MINVNEMSNSELVAQKLTLTNQYEAIKNEIEKLCEKLKSTEKDFFKIDNELKIRGCSLR